MATIASASGAYQDGSGNPNQGHLIYAANSGVWWLFTITSASDTTGNPGTHTIKSYVSSGPDLSTATWSASTSSPNLNSDSGGLTAAFRNGRSLGCYYVNNNGKDFVHISASMFMATQPDAGNGYNGHARALLTATTITWSNWGIYETASFNYTSAVLIAGNAVGRTSDGYIVVGGATYHQELDCSLVVSVDPDLGDNWTVGGEGTCNTTASANITNISNQDRMNVGQGLSYSAVGTAAGATQRLAAITGPTTVTSSVAASGSSTGGRLCWTQMTCGTTRTNLVCDDSMANKCAGYSFAQLANGGMMAIYDSGGAAPPNFTDLKSMRANQTPAQGFWPSTFISGPGSAAVFGSANTQDMADWCAVGVNTTTVFACRRTSATQIAVNTCNVTAHTWSALGNQPPAMTGKTIVAGGGVMGCTDGVDFWLFVIDSTDAAIKYCKLTVAAGTWGSWTSLTSVGATAKFLSGQKQRMAGQLGLIWTEQNGSNFDTKITSLSAGTDVATPAVSLGAHRRDYSTFPKSPMRPS